MLFGSFGLNFNPHFAFLREARFVNHGIYIYNEIILQFFVFPTQNCVLHTGKPARNNFSCNFFVSFLLFIPILMVEIGQKMENLGVFQIVAIVSE